MTTSRQRRKLEHVERAHRNPFRHWASGLVTEIAVFAGVILLLAGVCLAAGLLR